MKTDYLIRHKNFESAISYSTTFELWAREGGWDSDVRHVATCFRYSRSAMSAVRPGELNIKCDPSSLWPWPLWCSRLGESALPWPSHHHGPSSSPLHQVRQGDQEQEKRRWQNQASGKQQKSNYRIGLNFYKWHIFYKQKGVRVHIYEGLKWNIDKSISYCIGSCSGSV